MKISFLMQIIGMGCIVTLVPIFLIDSKTFGASTIFYFVLLYQLGLLMEAYQYKPYSSAQHTKRQSRIQNSIQLIILWLFMIAALNN